MRDLWRKVRKVPSFGTFCTLATIFSPEAAGANTVPPSESDDFSNLTDCESCQIFALVAFHSKFHNPDSVEDACHYVLHLAPALTHRCTLFMRKEATRLDMTSKRRGCVRSLKCNAFTTWNEAEVLAWHKVLQLQPLQELLDDYADHSEKARSVHQFPSKGKARADPLEPECRDYEDLYQDLAKIRIVAVVFTGRGSRMKALLPYLRRDLKVHKGVLDGIVFALIRPDPPAMELVQRMVMEYGEQIQVQDYTGTWKDRMADLYTSFNDTRAVYIKIDDDIVYLAKHALAELAREKLRRRCLFVSANVVNHAILSSVHQDHGAHRAFEMDLEHEGTRTMDDQDAKAKAWSRVGDVNMNPSYLFERHPMGSCVFKRWDCAALVHESFLDRERDGTMCAFDFGWYDFHRAGFREHEYVHLSPWMGTTWRAAGARWSINLFAFQTSNFDDMDWSRVYGPGDDEEEFGSNHAERRGQHACALGRSIAVHFSYNTQEERLMKFTNLLERYVDLAKHGAVAKYFLN
eukprot:symbB.v1.2.024980.t1/scaffold2400.1/size80086/5